jgi:hypothetical protein
LSDGLVKDKESASFSQHTFDTRCTFHHPDVYTCDALTSDKDPSKSCLSALFIEAPSASDLCLLQKAPTSPAYARVGQERVYIFAPEAIATMLGCKTAAPKYATLHARGPIEVKIHKGCTLDTPLWRFESPGSLTSSSSSMTKRINIGVHNNFVTSTTDQHPIDNVTIEAATNILLDFTKTPRPEVNQPWWPFRGPILMSLIFSVYAAVSATGIFGFLCYRAHITPNV